MTWTMPSETALHETTWMAFPRQNSSIGDTPEEADAARAAWSTVAHAIAEFEPVRMVVDPDARADAARFLSAEIELLEAPLDDCWMRDMGPTFVVDEGGLLGGVDWVFNGWGAATWASWARDREIARFAIDVADARLVSSMMVNEGGGITVDGEGTVLVTETVQLDPGRNPYADKASIEAELARTIGATKVIWLPRGLTRDYDDFGTRGHVDIVATIPSPGTLLVHLQTDARHPDCEVSKQIRSVLEATTDAAGREWNIIDLPAPATVTDAHGFVDYSYVNHLVVNGGVIACGFGEDYADARARDILAQAYPGREIVTVDARELFARGGGIHCITQQQPAALAR